MATVRGTRYKQARVARMVVALVMIAFAAVDPHGSELRSSGAVALIPLTIFVVALQGVDLRARYWLQLVYVLLVDLSLFMAFVVGLASDGDLLPTVGLATPPLVLAVLLGEWARRRAARMRGDSRSHSDLRSARKGSAG
jgi:predicted acyltransferase